MPISTKSRKTGIKIKPLHLDHPDAREVYFPAIITEFSNKIEPKWNEEEVYARMDPLATYKNTTRKISFAFRVISNNIEEAQINMGYLQALLQYQYPRFKDYGGKEGSKGPSVLQSPPFFEIRFMNIIMSAQTPNTGLQGYISNIQHNVTFGQQNNSQIFDNTNDRLHFSDFTISIDFVVLHEKPIGWYGGDSTGNSDVGGYNYPYGVTPSAEINYEIINEITDSVYREEALNGAQTQIDGQEDNDVINEKIESRYFGSLVLGGNQ